MLTNFTTDVLIPITSKKKSMLCAESVLYALTPALKDQY